MVDYANKRIDPSTLSEDTPILCLYLVPVEEQFDYDPLLNNKQRDLVLISDDMGKIIDFYTSQLLAENERPYRFIQEYDFPISIFFKEGLLRNYIAETLEDLPQFIKRIMSQRGEQEAHEAWLENRAKTCATTPYLS